MVERSDRAPGPRCEQCDHLDRIHTSKGYCKAHECPCGGLINEEVVRELATRYTRKEIAQMYALDRHTIAGWFRKAGVKTEKKPLAWSLTEAQEKRILELLSEGMPVMFVAAEVGVNLETVRERTKQIPHWEENVREWRTSWARIRPKPELVKLHREFDMANHRKELHGYQGKA